MVTCMPGTHSSSWARPHLKLPFSQSTMRRLMDAHVRIAMERGTDNAIDSADIIAINLNVDQYAFLRSKGHAIGTLLGRTHLNDVQSRIEDRDCWVSRVTTWMSPSGDFDGAWLSGALPSLPPSPLRPPLSRLIGGLLATLVRSSHTPYCRRNLAA